MDCVCQGSSQSQGFGKELHHLCNLVFEGFWSMSPILEFKPVKWIRPVWGWKWWREFSYVNSCIQPSSLFLSAAVNGEILFVPCCWKYFCISAHQATIKLLLKQNVSVPCLCSGVGLVLSICVVTIAAFGSFPLRKAFCLHCQSL